MTDKPAQKKSADDLDAVRQVVSTLELFDEPARERILRWAREKLGMAGTPASAASSSQPAASGLSTAPASTGAAGGQDIKTFIDSKGGMTDQQFAAAVAYYYRFVAPAAEQKEQINASDLMDACRKVGRRRPGKPAQTLGNAADAGYLDKSGHGHYKINSVGENLVAVVLPSSEGKPRSIRRKRSGARKPESHSTRAAKRHKGA